MVPERIVENPLDSKEIKPVHPKGNQSWIFTERTDAEVDASNILPEQRQKINYFPGIIAVVTIFTLNLYIGL